MTDRKRGPEHDEILAVIQEGPISVFLMAERLGCNRNLISMRCGELLKQGRISQFKVLRKNRNSDYYWVWYIPGCGIPPEAYKGAIPPLPKPRKQYNCSIGLDDEHQGWMEIGSRSIGISGKERQQRKMLEREGPLLSQNAHCF